MTSRLRITLLSVSFAMLIAACDHSVYSVRQSSLRGTADFHYAAGNKSLPTQIYGNAFDQQQADFEQRVLRAMQAVNNGHAEPLVPRTDFVAVRDADANFKVVVVIDGRADVPGYALCRNDFRHSAIKEESLINIRMSFCFQQSLVTSVLGTTPRSDDHNDARFDRLISHLTVRLFEVPRQERQQRSGILIDF